MRTFLVFLAFSSLSLYGQKDSLGFRSSVGISGLPLYFRTVDNEISYSGAAIKGSFGVFVSKNFSLENNLFYYRNEDVLKDGPEVSSESYGLQVGLRYHFWKIKFMALYADLGFGFGSVKYYDKHPWNANYNFNSGIFLFTGGVGTVIPLFANLNFELQFPYLNVFTTTQEENIYNNDGGILYSGMAGPNIGFRYFFK